MASPPTKTSPKGLARHTGLKQYCVFACLATEPSVHSMTRLRSLLKKLGFSSAELRAEMSQAKPSRQNCTKFIAVEMQIPKGNLSSSRRLWVFSNKPRLHDEMELWPENGTSHGWKAALREFHCPRCDHHHAHFLPSRHHCSGRRQSLSACESNSICLRTLFCSFSARNTGCVNPKTMSNTGNEFQRGLGCSCSLVEPQHSLPSPVYKPQCTFWKHAATRRYASKFPSNLRCSEEAME